MADIASDAIDTARIAAVSTAVGPQRLRELLLILGTRIETLAAAAQASPEDCLATLHQTRGSASSLGLVALARALGRMEDHAKHGRDVLEAAREMEGVWKEAKEALLF